MWFIVTRSAIVAVIISIVIMAGKEVYDRDVKGTKIDVYDMIANILGILAFIITKVLL